MLFLLMSPTEEASDFCLWTPEWLFLEFLKCLQIAYSDLGPCPINTDHEHRSSYPFRRRPQLEAQAQEIISCYESFNIISVSTGWRQISQNLLLQMEWYFCYYYQKYSEPSRKGYLPKHGQDAEAERRTQCRQSILGYGAFSHEKQEWACTIYPYNMT